LEAEASGRKADVDGTAAAAAAVAERHQMLLVHVDPIALGGATTTLNPATHWATMLTPQARFSLSPTTVLSCLDQLVGGLNVKIEDAQAAERTLAGRVARVVRFPSDVREAAGLDRRSRKGRAVQGLLSALLVTIVGGVIVGIILALLHLA
jgi:hypothetical protein